MYSSGHWTHSSGHESQLPVRAPQCVLVMALSQSFVKAWCWPQNKIRKRVKSLRLEPFLIQLLACRVKHGLHRWTGLSIAEKVARKESQSTTFQSSWSFQSSGPPKRPLARYQIELLFRSTPGLSHQVFLDIGTSDGPTRSTVVSVGQSNIKQIMCNW